MELILTKREAGKLVDLLAKVIAGYDGTVNETARMEKVQLIDLHHQLGAYLYDEAPNRPDFESTRFSKSFYCNPACPYITQGFTNRITKPEEVYWCKIFGPASTSAKDKRLILHHIDCDRGI